MPSHTAVKGNHARRVNLPAESNSSGRLAFAQGSMAASTIAVSPSLTIATLGQSITRAPSAEVSRQMKLDHVEKTERGDREDPVPTGLIGPFRTDGKRLRSAAPSTCSLQFLERAPANDSGTTPKVERL